MEHNFKIIIIQTPKTIKTAKTIKTTKTEKTTKTAKTIKFKAKHIKMIIPMNY